MEFASRNFTAGELDDIVLKLGKKEGVRRFMDDEVVLSVPRILTYPVFKLVTLGANTKTPGGLRRLLKSARVDLDEYANKFLRHNDFVVSQTKVELDTVVFSANNLGIYGTPTSRSWRDLIHRAFSLGFTKCPDDLGPQLRLQYMDQPKNERLIIVMNSFRGASWVPAYFHLVHDGEAGLQLVGGNGNTNFCLYDEEQFVFVRPRNVLSQ